MEQTLSKADGAAFPFGEDECFVAGEVTCIPVLWYDVALLLKLLGPKGLYLSAEYETNGTEDETVDFPEFWTTGKHKANGVDYTPDLRGGSCRLFKHPSLIQEEEPPYTYDIPFTPGNRTHLNLSGLFDRLPGVTVPHPAHDRDCCFLLVGCEKPSVRRDLAMLPVLVPCSGKLSRSGEKMQYFDAFLSCLEQPRRHLLTPDQHALQELGLAMVKLAEQLPGSLLELEHSMAGAANDLFLLWEKALPMLFHQHHVFRYPIGGRTGLKGKPEKSRIGLALIGKERPQLSFELSNYENHIVLKPVLRLRGKRVSAFESRMPLFVSIGNTYYLASSLRDAAALEWMDGLNNRITVLKEDEAVFRKEVLEILEQLYEVKRL
ncbi:MAG: hypothetical protein ACO1NW_02755 [Chitinophagaceae bacterium]